MAKRTLLMVASGETINDNSSTVGIDVRYDRHASLTDKGIESAKEFGTTLKINNLLGENAVNLTVAISQLDRDKQFAAEAGLESIVNRVLNPIELSDRDYKKFRNRGKLSSGATAHVEEFLDKLPEQEICITSSLLIASLASYRGIELNFPTHASMTEITV